MKKKVLSLLLALCMLLSLLPATAFAEVDEYYHNDGIISHFSCSPTGVQYRLTTYVDGWPVYKGEEIHAHTATIYRLSSGTSVEVGEETATYDSIYPTTTATLSVTRDLTPGLYLFVATMTVDDGDDDDDQVTGCKVFEISGAWQDSFTDLSEAYPANTYATWSDVHRIDQDTTDGVNYAPSVSLTTPGGASGFNGESNSRDLTVNLKGFVLGTYNGLARTVYQDQAVYSVTCSATGCDDHDYRAYRNVYYQLASLSDIEVYMKAHTESDWVKVRSTEEGQYADASVPASFSDITWKFTNSVKETADDDANVNITLTFPAGMDVGNVYVKVVPNAEVHMTPWYWSDEIADSYTYGSAVVSESSLYKNSGAANFTQTGCKCTATYLGNSTSNTLTCKGDTEAASHTDFVTSAEYTLAVYPNRVAVSGERYAAKYTEIPNPTNEKLDLTYTGGANPQSHFVSYAGTAHATTKQTLSSGSMSETGENWSWYPNNNWTGSSALAGYDIPAGTKNVLMLNNFYMEHDSTSDNDTPVILPADTTIVLADGSVNKIVNTDSVVGLSKSIYCLGNLTIMGGGALTVEGNSYGIYANGDVTVKSGTVTATGKDGIWAKQNVTIEGNSNVTATSDGNGNGIYAKMDVVIRGAANVTAKGHNGDVAKEYAGIFAVNGDVTVSGGAVYAEAVFVNAAKGIYGIFAENGNVAISGGTVVASGSDVSNSSDAVSAGIYAKKLADITGGKVTAVGGNVEAGYKAGSYGIVAADVNIADAEVTATAGTASATNMAASVGISADYHIVTTHSQPLCNATITDAKVVATGAAATGAGDECYSAGIGAAKYVTIASGSDVTAVGVEYGIIADRDDVVIDNAKVTVTAANKDGINAGHDVIATDSDITVTNAGDDGIFAKNNVSISGGCDVSVNSVGEGIIAYTGSVTASVTNLNVNAKADGIEAKTGITVKATVATVTSLNTDAIFTDEGGITIDAATLYVKSDAGDAIDADKGDVTVKGNKATIVAGADDNAIEANAGSVYVDVVNFETEDDIFADNNVVASDSNVNVKATSFVAGDIKANGNNGNVTVEANVATVTNIEATAKATLSKNVTVTGDVTAKNVEIKAGADVKAENVTAIVGITVNDGAKLTVEQTASATDVFVNATTANTVLSANKVVAKEKLTVEGAVNNYVTATIGKATVDADTVTASETSMKGNANVTAKSANLGTFTTIPASNPKGFYVQKAQEYTTNALYWREDSGLTSKSGLKLTGVSGGKFVFAPAGFAYKPVVSYGGGGAAPVVTVTSSMPMLRKGNTGDAVKTLQAKLNALGYNCGAVDGVFGNDTYNAVVKYQKAMGITVDGVVGKATWGKLGVTGTTVTVAATTSVTSTTTTSATSNMPMLRKGNTGDAVKTLQTKLNALGYNCGAVDGVFGTNTYNAVVKFQKDKGLSADGVVGNQTWAKLG